MITIEYNGTIPTPTSYKFAAYAGEYGWKAEVYVIEDARSSSDSLPIKTYVMNEHYEYQLDTSDENENRYFQTICFSAEDLVRYIIRDIHEDEYEEEGTIGDQAHFLLQQLSNVDPSIKYATEQFEIYV